MQALLALPYPKLRHLEMAWDEIDARSTLAGKLAPGQLAAFTSQRTSPSEHADVEESVTELDLKCGTGEIESLSRLREIFHLHECRFEPRAYYIRVRMAPECIIPEDEIVALVAKATRERLRSFVFQRTTFAAALEVTDEGIKMLVTLCPLVEEVALPSAVCVTPASMQLMRARWFHTLRSLDVEGSHPDVVNQAHEWALNRAPKEDMATRWFSSEQGMFE